MKNESNLKPLSDALEDHSAEGIAILSAEPGRFSQMLVVAMAVMMLAALVWSFVGRADVIVTADGVLAPESDVRRVYAPIDGELADIYMEPGQPVSQGDVIARLDARGAVEAAAQALEAQLKLEDAEREWKNFPDKKALLERRAAALKQQIEVALKVHEKRTAEGTTKLAEAQRAQVLQARSELDNARQLRDAAREEMARFQRLLALPGGGGVSELQVEQKKTAYLAAENALRAAQGRLGELEFRLSQESDRASVELETSDQELTRLRLQYDAALREMTNEENKLRLQLQSARLAANAAERVRFENIDKDNFLLILAPVSGVVTDVATTQPGDKIQANTPLGGIAPKDARAVLKLQIAERDRAFLREGQPVKLKFAAFPYQRYGLIDGNLEYISPTTLPAAKTKEPVYEGHVALARDHYEVAGEAYPVRYGMTAVAEIVVRERRLIDLALDPFRQIRG
ncbi:MAG: HlyD family efflux transporter periplasmic adaptor subunit [Aromatoleum sp.]|jgi:HlyD family secretion protein|uniref:HlyD family efflux transporter periplasmic adaptor subunit n=1 Tax=Aromatoleum sp. TaxID=2307007 RepID=UPI002895E092|nr:HlyD family efflux transporter periplasmic adaptor subunit [Aromatoleum sp.]MDT3671453.1 HlyD family efflux transporter periplasmic adaptor subunit [Aromatoleum sp.]